jgi:hypothetical protein
LIYLGALASNCAGNSGHLSPPSSRVFHRASKAIDSLVSKGQGSGNGDSVTLGQLAFLHQPVVAHRYELLCRLISRRTRPGVITSPYPVLPSPVEVRNDLPGRYPVSKLRKPLFGTYLNAFAAEHGSWGRIKLRRQWLVSVGAQTSPIHYNAMAAKHEH